MTVVFTFYLREKDVWQDKLDKFENSGKTRRILPVTNKGEEHDYYNGKIKLSKLEEARIS